MSHLMKEGRKSHLMMEESHTWWRREVTPDDGGKSYLMMEGRKSHLMKEVTPDEGGKSHLMKEGRKSHLMMEERKSHLMTEGRKSHLMKEGRKSHLIMEGSHTWWRRGGSHTWWRRGGSHTWWWRGGSHTWWRRGGSHTWWRREVTPDEGRNLHLMEEGSHTWWRKEVTPDDGGEEVRVLNDNDEYQKMSHTTARQWKPWPRIKLRLCHWWKVAGGKHGSALTAIKSAPAAEATAADNCLLPVLPSEHFYRGVFVSLVLIKHIVYSNVIGQMLIYTTHKKSRNTL